MFLASGLDIKLCDIRLRELPDGLTVRRWCELGHSGDAALLAIRERMTSAPPGILASLGITCDAKGEFRIPVRTFLLVGSKQR